MVTRIATLLALALASCAAPAGPGEAVWTRRYDGPAGAADRVLSVVADGDGAIVAGWETDLTEDADLLIMRYRGDGSLDWVVEEDAGPEAGLFASDMVRTEDGGLVLAGGVYAEATDWDVWIRRLNPDMSIRWTRRIEGGADALDEAVAVALAPDGGLAVSGFIMLADGTTDAAVWRLDADGDILWTHTHDGAGRSVDAAIELTFLPGGDLVTVGYATSDLEIGDWDVWMRRLDPGGGEVWTVLREKEGGDRAQAVALLPDGDLAVGGFLCEPGRALDAWLARYDPDGSLVWEQLSDGPGGFADAVNDIAVSTDGTLVVGGYEFVDDEGFDAFVRHYEPDGTLIWSHEIRGPGRVVADDGTIRGADDVIASVAVTDTHVYSVGSQVITQVGETWDVDTFVRKLAL